MIHIAGRLDAPKTLEDNIEPVKRKLPKEQ
jgi:hypothetical protein